MPRLPQSDIIFGAILLAFLVYITLRGQLPGYAQLFVHNNSTPGHTGSGTPGVPGSHGASDLADTLGNAAQSATTLASVVAGVSKVAAFLAI